jgi:hypothetical protein
MFKLFKYKITADESGAATTILTFKIISVIKIIKPAVILNKIILPPKNSSQF